MIMDVVIIVVVVSRDHKPEMRCLPRTRQAKSVGVPVTVGFTSKEG